MNRLSLLVFWISVIVGASFMLYRVKYEVQGVKSQIEQTHREMLRERQQLLVEEAEWAHLNQPKNLRRLTKKYLSGKNITTEQIAEIEAISFRSQSVASVDIDSAARPIIASYNNSSARP